MGIFDRILGKAKPTAEPAPVAPPTAPPTAQPAKEPRSNVPSVATPDVPAAKPIAPVATPAPIPVIPMEAAAATTASPPTTSPPAAETLDWRDALPPAVAVAPAKEQPAEKKGFFSRLKSGLSKTAALLKTDIRDLFKREGRLIDDAFLDELFAALIKTDLGVKAAKEIVVEVQVNFRGRVVEMSDVLATVKAKLKSLMAQAPNPIKLAASGPTVIMICGVNGSGKTTSIAKLAHRFVSERKRVVLGAADTFRAAAVEQLTVWAGRVGAELVTGAAGSDPASVAHRAVSRAIESQAEICIVDTAGRLQTQTSLMQELTKIQRVVSKLIPDAPHEVLLVLDATAGQNGVSQAKGFTDAVQCTGIVLAKLDGTAKGGVVVPIRQEFKLPVKFVGLGESLEDLATFDPNDFVEALFADAAAAGTPVTM
jgi:fused signal recognition particle receptor